MNAKTKTPVSPAMQKLLNKIKTLEAKIVELEARPVRDRGPASTRTMTEADAREILIGKRKDQSHRLAATELGLSYGQIYSARNGFTFKAVYKEFRDAQKPAKKTK